jgi:demethylmenaquinone methyltransferase/2-methoxy-6-polyprenyl-1,4-benzoquinol methylase
MQQNQKTSGYYREECNRIAWLYDPLVRLLAISFGGERKIRRGVLNLLSLKAGDKVLDVACGTGTSAILMSEKVGADGEVVGIDLSPNMIKIAKGKVKSPDNNPLNPPLLSGNISFLNANSEDIPYPDNYFDKVHISAALHEMIYEGRINTLKEIYRVLKPSGTFVAADYYNKPHGIIAKLIFKFLMFIEADTARDMMKRGLSNEINDEGFDVKEVVVLLRGMAQIIVAGKS